MNIRHGVSPYDIQPDGVTPGFFPYRYPPGLAYVAQVLTFLSPFTAYRLWVLFLEGLLVYFIYLLRRQMEDEHLFLISAGALLLSTPYFLELHMGQFTFATIALCFIALMKFQEPVSKVYLAFSIFLKPLTVVTFPVFIKNAKGRISVLVSLGVLLLSCSLFWIYLKDWEEFYKLNLNPTGMAGAFGVGNYGFVQFLFLLAYHLHLNQSLLIFPAVIKWYRLILLVFTAGIVLFSKAHRFLLAGVLLLAHFLSYSHTWEHHMSGVCIIAVMFLCIQRVPRWFHVLTIVSLIMLIFPTPFYFLDRAFPPNLDDPFFGWPLFVLYGLLLSKVVPTLILYFASMTHVMRSGFISVSSWKQVLDQPIKVSDILE
jgi:hypothetical protein